MTNSSETPGSGLLATLRQSPMTQQLGGHLRELAEAEAHRLSGSVGERLGSVTRSLGEVGETGSLPAIGEGLKRVVQGDSPAKAALGAVKTDVVDKVKSAFGKGKASGPKATNIEETIDVGVPVSTAYNQWTQFTEFPKFMKGVESVEQTSDVESNWRVKVFKSRRSWKANIQEQIPDYRIVWTSEGAKGSTKGTVTFHALGENLTRINLVMEYFPSGLFEKTGNIWRAGGRRARLDLKHFRRYIMLQGEETGAWRGEIRDGEVVSSGDEGEESQDGNDRRERGAQGRADGSEAGDEEQAENGQQRRRPPAAVAGTQRARRDRQEGERSERSAGERPAQKAAKKAPAKKGVAKKAAKKAPPAKASRRGE